MYDLISKQNPPRSGIFSYYLSLYWAMSPTGLHRPSSLSLSRRLLAEVSKTAHSNIQLFYIFFFKNSDQVPPLLNTPAPPLSLPPPPPVTLLFSPISCFPLTARFPPLPSETLPCAGGCRCSPALRSQNRGARTPPGCRFGLRARRLPPAGGAAPQWPRPPPAEVRLRRWAGPGPEASGAARSRWRSPRERRRAGRSVSGRAWGAGQPGARRRRRSRGERGSQVPVARRAGSGRAACGARDGRAAPPGAGPGPPRRPGGGGAARSRPGRRS